MTKPLSAADVRAAFLDGLGTDGWLTMIRGLEAIRDGHHVVIERVTEAEAMKAYLDSSVAFRKSERMDVWLAAYRALGAIKGE